MTWLRAAVLFSLVAVGLGCFSTKPTTKRPNQGYSPHTTTTTTPSTLNKNCKCGVRNEGTHNGGKRRIVGGYTVDKNEYPWQVGLTTCRPGYTLGDCSPKLNCGGSIVSSKTIVTAAHCLGRYVPKRVYHGPISYVITLMYPGQYFYTQKHLFAVVAEHDKEKSDGEKYYEVCKLEYHQEYKDYHKDKKDKTHDYDYAVLTLCDELKWAKDIAPICLPESSRQGTKYEQVNSIATGWGETTVNEESSNILREVPLKTLSNRACCTSYGWGCNQITDRMICGAPIDGNKGGCKGDSGGPLIHEEGKSYTLIGIASFVSECDKLDKIPTVFARVTNQLDWIDARIKGERCARA